MVGRPNLTLHKLAREMRTVKAIMRMAAVTRRHRVCRSGLSQVRGGVRTRGGCVGGPGNTRRVLTLRRSPIKCDSNVEKATREISEQFGLPRDTTCTITGVQVCLRTVLILQVREMRNRHSSSDWLAININAIK